MSGSPLLAITVLGAWKISIQVGYTGPVSESPFTVASHHQHTHMQHFLDVNKDQACDVKRLNFHKGAGFGRYSHLIGKNTVVDVFSKR